MPNKKISSGTAIIQAVGRSQNRETEQGRPPQKSSCFTLKRMRKFGFFTGGNLAFGALAGTLGAATIETYLNSHDYYSIVVASAASGAVGGGSIALLSSIALSISTDAYCDGQENKDFIMKWISILIAALSACIGATLLSVINENQTNPFNDTVVQVSTIPGTMELVLLGLIVAAFSHCCCPTACTRGTESASENELSMP